MKSKCLYSILDRNFVIGFKAFCKSLTQYNPWLKAIPVDFLITNIDLTDEDKKYCESYYPKIIWLEPLEAPNHFKAGQTKIGQAAFHKLRPFLIKDYDLVISIDCGDMIIKKSISELFSYNEDIAMVQGWTKDHGWHCQKKAGGTFNGGLVLLNKTYRTENIYKKLIEHPVTPYYDQQIINNFFKNKITKLPWKYNFSKRMIENDQTNIKDAVIVHYVGEKPWNDYKNKLLYKQVESIWHEYAR